MEGVPSGRGQDRGGNDQKLKKEIIPQFQKWYGLWTLLLALSKEGRKKMGIGQIWNCQVASGNEDGGIYGN
jgi:hypothetical protein